MSTSMLARGAEVEESVMVPEMRPPSVSAKFIPVVVAPAVTRMGVPDVTSQAVHTALL